MTHFLNFYLKSLIPETINRDKYFTKSHCFRRLIKFHIHFFRFRLKSGRCPKRWWRFFCVSGEHALSSKEESLWDSTCSCFMKR
ncbi:unnamed protein product [Brassica oleracea]